MTTVDEADQLIDRYQQALDDFMKGHPQPVKELFSHKEDVTLANHLGPPVRGWELVAEAMERAASNVRDGRTTGFETVAKHVSSEFAYIVEIERGEAKIVGSEDVSPWALRATMIFRPEDGEWKIVHRHADPITTPQPAESLIQE